MPPTYLCIPRDELFKSLGRSFNAFMLGERVEVTPEFLAKSQRWITVHPWGRENDGIPVMIEDEGNGKGHVVGGAGGRLNFMRLTNLKSEDQLREQAKARRKAKADQKKEEVKRGVKQAPPADAEIKKRRMEYIEKMAPRVGLKNWKLDESKLAHLSEGARNVTLARHYRRVEGEIKRAVADVKKSIVLDLDKRREAGLSELPLTSKEEDVISLADLEGDKTKSRGLGYAREVADKAETRGKPEVQQEFEALVESGDLAGARQAMQQLAADLKGYDTPRADKQAAALEDAVTLPDEEFAAKAPGVHDNAVLRVEAEDVKAERRRAMEHPEFAKSMEVLMSEINDEARIGKEIALGSGMARDEKALTPAEQVELLRDAKRYDMEVKRLRQEEDPGFEPERDRRGIHVDFTRDEVDEAVLQDLHNRTMSLRNTALLDEAKRLAVLTGSDREPDESSMERAYSEGAYNSVNRLALNAGGAPLVDRHAVDTLGMEAVAHCIARRIHAGNSPEDVEAIVKGLEDFHVDEQSKRVDEAVREAREAIDAAKEIETGTVESPVDLVVAEELNERRRAAIVSARNALGRTLGEFEANAALIMALKEKPRNGTVTRLGDTAVDSAIREARSLGLTQGEDYEITDLKDQPRTLALTASGMDKVAQKPDPERAMLYRDMQDIKSGLYDEDDWIPTGMARRKIDPTSVPPVPNLSFSEDLDMSGVTDPAQVRASVNDYILGRFNDGMGIDAIREDLYSAEFAVQHGINDGNMEAWLKSVDELLPQVYPTQYAHDKTASLRGPDGKPLPGREAEHRRAWNEAIREASDQNTTLAGQVRQRLLADSRAFADREAARTGNPVPPLHDQELDTGTPETVESAFRAVASHPGGMVAFKAVGDLNRADRALLRRHYLSTYAPAFAKPADKVAESGAKDKASLTKMWSEFRSQHGENVYSAIQTALKGKGKRGLFGVEVLPIAAVDLNDADALAGIVGDEVGMSPTAIRSALAHPQYKPQVAAELRNAAEESLRRAYFTDVLGVDPDQYADYRDGVARSHDEAWGNYVMLMGGERQAYEALQHDIRGDVVGEFSRQYAGLTGQSLKTSPVDLPGRDKHLKGTLPPEKMRDMLAKEQAKRARELALAATRSQGKFAPGARAERADAIRAALKRTGQRSLFRVAESPAEKLAPREAGRRLTIGDRAEAQLGSVISNVARTMPYGKPLKLWTVSLNGRYVMGQRAIRALDRAHRVVFAAGVGSGKTVMALGSFAHLHGQGKVKRALMAVPSIVQGQFAGEAARYLEPGKFMVHAQPGEERNARIAAMKDPANHVAVFTHQSVRDDGLHLMEKHLGITQEKFDAMTRPERAAAVRDAFAKEGIDVQMMVLDEGHDALNRRGKPDSTLAHVLDAISDNVPYYAPMTADPMKNDVSEVFDWLTKLDPKRYPSDSRSDFLARYGNNTVASREALQREIAPFWYSGRVDLATRARKHVVKLDLAPAQKADYDKVHELYNRARAARSRGQVDVEAIKALSPSSFDGVAPENVESTAKWLSNSLGMLRESALSRVVNTHESDDNAKVRKAVEIAAQGKKDGKPGVVFAHNLAAVDRLRKGFEKAGLRVGVITGGNSAKEKDAVKLGFNPEQGAVKYDVLLCSDAGAVGMNAQTGKWLVNYDTPDTAKTHNQRIGRIHRIGQNDDVDIYDLVSNTAHETARRERLHRKYALGDIFQSPLESLDDTGLSHFIAAARAQQNQGKVVDLPPPPEREPALMVAEGK